MPTETLVVILIVLVSAGASFFFALAETALLSLGKWQARQLAEKDPRMGDTIRRLLERSEDLLATMVLGNTFANAAMLIVALWMALSGRWSPWPTILGLLVITLFACEVLPKTLAVRRPDLWAVRVAAPLLFFQKLTLPIRWLAQKLNELILSAVVPKSVRPQNALTDADYQELIELAAQQGALAVSEKEIILQIISLDRRTARDVMRPRSRMACISDDSTVEEMLAAARKYKHRRLPMYDETPDTIVGILNARALLLDPKIDMADAIEFPSFVPESMNLLQLLKSLQRQRRGVAIVLDEFGGTAGLVTLQDILSELVGRIRAEDESQGFVMEAIAPGRWRLNGTMRIDDFRREHPAVGEVQEVETMGGLLAHVMGVVPAPGESVTYRGLKLTAQVTDERRVRELLVERTK
jgi:putative hemolysin